MRYTLQFAEPFSDFYTKGCDKMPLPLSLYWYENDGYIAEHKNSCHLPFDSKLGGKWPQSVLHGIFNRRQCFFPAQVCICISSPSVFVFESKYICIQVQVYLYPGQSVIFIVLTIFSYFLRPHQEQTWQAY